VLSHPDAPASKAIIEMAQKLGTRPRGLVGMNLGITPDRK